MMSDSDWAGNSATRKSASCGALQIGGCTVACFARGQNAISHSSCEAEFYAAVMTTAEACHVQQIVAWSGLVLRVMLLLDSSAARRALHRQGVGRMRHMEVKSLWIQSLVAEGRLLLNKISSQDNISDIGTKPLPGARFVKLRTLLGLVSVSIGQVSSARVTVETSDATPEGRR